MTERIKDLGCDTDIFYSLLGFFKNEILPRTTGMTVFLSTVPMTNFKNNCLKFCYYTSERHKLTCKEWSSNSLR